MLLVNGNIVKEGLDLVEGILAEGLAAMELDDGNLMDALMKAVAQGRSCRLEWSGMAVAGLAKPLPVARPKARPTPEPQPQLEISEVPVGAGAIQYAFLQ